MGRGQQWIVWIWKQLAGPALSLALASTAAASDEFEREPINYSLEKPDNRVSRLQERIDSGLVKPVFEKERGYARWLLAELQVPQSSQVLVFSKTSLQRTRIAPKTPRALYFSDDVYVGYCQFGHVMEISAVDPKLGTVFYTLDQDTEEKLKFVRHTDSCLLCHASSQTRGIPGHLVRSVYPDTRGDPILSSGSFRIDQTSPIERRWGGWYVTGTHGKMKHLGNLVIADKRPPEQVENLKGLNVTSLKDRCETSPYLTPHSDIVALMVLEHQTEMHNVITRANFQTRLALHDEAVLNKEIGRPTDYRSETTTRRIKSVCDALVKYVLFSGEAALTDTVEGTSSFTKEFAKTGPRDSKGRSLREFDLRTRLFRYPCSYLIYSPAFDGLPAEAKDYTLRRLHDVLKGQVYTRDFDHLTTDGCNAIYEILVETKKDLPAYWRESGTRP
jgi:hypothetical protein